MENLIMDALVIVCLMIAAYNLGRIATVMEDKQ